MSADQAQNFRLLKNLLRQLAAFGLNPSDWKIERAGTMNARVGMRHRRDLDFRLFAETLRTPTGILKLESLTVASL